MLGDLSAWSGASLRGSAVYFTPDGLRGSGIRRVQAELH